MPSEKIRNQRTEKRENSTKWSIWDKIKEIPGTLSQLTTYYENKMQNSVKHKPITSRLRNGRLVNTWSPTGRQSHHKPLAFGRAVVSMLAYNIPAVDKLKKSITGNWWDDQEKINILKGAYYEYYGKTASDNQLVEFKDQLEVKQEILKGAGLTEREMAFVLSEPSWIRQPIAEFQQLVDNNKSYIQLVTLTDAELENKVYNTELRQKSELFNTINSIQTIDAPLDRAKQWLDIESKIKKDLFDSYMGMRNQVEIESLKMQTLVNTAETKNSITNIYIGVAEIDGKPVPIRKTELINKLRPDNRTISYSNIDLEINHVLFKNER